MEPPASFPLPLPISAPLVLHIFYRGSAWCLGNAGVHSNGLCTTLVPVMCVFYFTKFMKARPGLKDLASHS